MQIGDLLGETQSCRSAPAGSNFPKEGRLQVVLIAVGRWRHVAAARPGSVDERRVVELIGVQLIVPTNTSSD
jgi:hypothetical protein